LRIINSQGAPDREVVMPHAFDLHQGMEVRIFGQPNP
jgi:hypothetical protein